MRRFMIAMSLLAIGAFTHAANMGKLRDCAQWLKTERLRGTLFHNPLVEPMPPLNWLPAADGDEAGQPKAITLRGWHNVIIMPDAEGRISVKLQSIDGPGHFRKTIYAIFDDEGNQIGAGVVPLGEKRAVNIATDDLIAEAPAGIILSGGPNSVYADDAPTVASELFDAGIPILGICYGHQLMAHILGGRTAAGEEREYGHIELDIRERDLLLKGVPSPAQTWMSHGDMVVEVPPGFQSLADTEHTPVAAMADTERHLYGVQFHPEVEHTPRGGQILRNFVHDVCGCSGEWAAPAYIQQAVRQLPEQIGDARVLCGVSGGVDSAVVAALLQRAVGDQLTAMFIDHGLLRKNEAERVLDVFRRRLGDALVAVDASDTFLEKLQGVTDPERKRQIIGETFIRTFEREAKKLGEFQYIAHGTLYPDVIESGGGHTATIKTHHNVGGLPEDMELENIESLRRLFKDEVR